MKANDIYWQFIDTICLHRKAKNNLHINSVFSARSARARAHTKRKERTSEQKVIEID